MKNIPGPNRFALTIALLLPVYFAVAALGTKFGLWSWQIGLGSLIIGAGPILLGIVALVGLVTLIMALRKKPRTGWWASLIALLLPLGVFGMLASVGGTAAENPIHDVATDTANPPQFSDTIVKTRADGNANPISDYSVPLGELEFWQAARVQDPLAAQSHAQIIGERYPDLGPILINAGDEAQALEAAKSAMVEMGFDDVLDDPSTGTVEAVAETFWFGFKDDVVVRVANGRVDFRSVSRVGQSDLGANAKRIAELRVKVEAKLAK